MADAPADGPAGDGAAAEGDGVGVADLFGEPQAIASIDMTSTVAAIRMSPPHARSCLVVRA